jgi:hypothetical protein
MDCPLKRGRQTEKSCLSPGHREHGHEDASTGYNGYDNPVAAPANLVV